MICDRIEDYLRARPPIPADLLLRAEALLAGDALDSFRRNFIRPPSENGKGRNAVTLSSHFFCARSIHYALQRTRKEPPAPRAFLAFHLGDNVEQMVVALAILAGAPVLWPTQGGQQKVVERVIDGDVIVGHVDAVLTADGCPNGMPVEVKSMSEYGFDKSRAEGVDDTFGYRSQLTNYMAALGSPRGLFVGVNKSTGHVFEEEIALDAKLLAANDAAYAEAKRGLPERPAWAKTLRLTGNPPGGGGKRVPLEQIDSVRCGYCAYRPVCWAGYEQVVVSGKPVYRRVLAQEEAIAT